MAIAGAGAQDFHTLVLSCNKDGMDSLRKGQSKAAFEQFKYAEAVLIANQAEGNHTGLLAVTCNNLGCYYKKVGKLHGALSYLRRAVKMEAELNTDEVTQAGTHLNICAILSKLEKHDKAVQHALCALDLINRRVGGAEPDKVSQDDYAVLAIAYHNVAVERDYLLQYDKAAAAFGEGHDIAKRCLGEDHPLAITLGKNCDAVLQKSKKASRAAPAGLTPHKAVIKDADLWKLTDRQESTEPNTGTGLPPVPGALPAGAPGGAANWADTEASAWSSFAHATLTGGALGGSEEQDVSLPPLAGAAAARAPGDDGADASPQKPRLGGKREPAQPAEEEPGEAMMDIVEADRTGHPVANTRQLSHDYRPNRQIKGSTRTARVVRRTGLQHCTKHRDEIVGNTVPSQVALVKSGYEKKIAAEKIQRAWRAWYRYCSENADWMTTSWICATIIQAKWRSYHVRRQKYDRAATKIQRRLRGMLVRKILRKHRAAVTIQRHCVGILTRSQLRRLQRAALKMQCLIRGGLARARVRRRRVHLTSTAITIQCGVRASIARRRVGEARVRRRAELLRAKAATDIQRVHRGNSGRQRFRGVCQEHNKNVREYQAATKLQALARRDAATKRVDGLRAGKLHKMNQAATLVRKMWLGFKTRKRYRELLNEFTMHERQVVTMQRMVRGCFVRLRMWRQAVRLEEQLWAGVQIQRVWRGYLGRVKWEAKYEEVWRREMAAVALQRSVRGWLERTRVGRMRRRMAREEFERARARFRAAQKIQGLTRGVLTRKVTSVLHARKASAAVQIQRIARGHALRRRLWAQVVALRATILQATARGFLVRNRRHHLIAKVICIQRAVRISRRRPDAVKQRAREERARRKENAAVIQKAVRSRQEAQEVDRIQKQG